MEKLKERYMQLNNAYATLERILARTFKQESLENYEELLIFLQDSLIKRFEHCYELTMFFYL